MPLGNHFVDIAGFIDVEGFTANDIFENLAGERQIFEFHRKNYTNRLLNLLFNRLFTAA